MCKIKKRLLLSRRAHFVRGLSFSASMTLVELIIVVVIIGIIASFAIPVYMGATTRAEGRDACNQVKLMYTAEKIKQLESGTYSVCTDYSTCNTALELDLPDDDWVYSVACIGGCSNDFSATAVKGGCTYAMTKTQQKPTAVGCTYIP